MDKQLAIGMLRLLVQNYSITNLLEMLMEAIRQERPDIAQAIRECLETGFPELRARMDGITRIIKSRGGRL